MKTDLKQGPDLELAKAAKKFMWSVLDSDPQNFYDCKQDLCKICAAGEALQLAIIKFEDTFGVQIDHE